MTIKTYGPGSTLYNTELNEIEDDYVDGGYTPWTIVGHTCFYMFPDIVGGPPPSRTYRYPLYGSPKADFHESRSYQNRNGLFREMGLAAGYLDPADFPSSYNGTLRTLQLRIVAHVVINGVPIANLLSTLALANVPNLATTTTGSGFTIYALGTSYGTITFPSMSDTLKSVRVDGDPFTFPAAGLYTLVLTPRFPNTTPDYGGCMVHTYLQRRAI